MRDIITLTKRNILVYLRDKASVFFSFLSIIILLLIYILFLGSIFDDLVGLTNVQKSLFLVGYIMGGVLVVGTVTLSLGVIGGYVNDIDTRKINGLLVSPAKHYKITISYFLSTTIVTIVLSLFMFLLVFLYLGLIVGYWYSILQFLSILGTIILFVAISTPIMIFIISFVKSMNAFGGVSSLVGTFIGFVAGVYFPLPQMGLTVQSIAGMLPFAHMGYFLRRLMMTDEIYKMVPQEYLTASGIAQIQVFGATIPIYLVFIVSAAVSMGLLVLTYIKMNKKQA